MRAIRNPLRIVEDWKAFDIKKVFLRTTKIVIVAVIWGRGLLF